VVTLPHIDRVAVAVPEHGVHDRFVGFAARLLRDR
jgi:hypothetical protein